MCCTIPLCLFLYHCMSIFSVQFDFLRLPSHQNCPCKIVPAIKDAKEYATKLVKQFQKMAKIVNRNVILVTMGNDLRYTSVNISIFCVFEILGLEAAFVVGSMLSVLFVLFFGYRYCSNHRLM